MKNSEMEQRLRVTNTEFMRNSFISPFYMGTVNNFEKFSMLFDISHLKYLTKCCKPPKRSVFVKQMAQSLIGLFPDCGFDQR